MSFRVILYSLKSDSKTGKTILSYDLNSDDLVIENTLEKLILKLDGKLFTIEKKKWLNTMKIFDTGITFFVLCNKQVNTNYIFEVLMRYAIQKVNTRIDFLSTLKDSYIKELNSLKLKAA